MAALLQSAGLNENESYAVIHPAAAFATKQWAADNFARVAEDLSARGLTVVAITAPSEASIADDLRANSAAPIITLTNLSLPQVAALTARARVFVGNDSGVAHIAAAVKVPSVVIFGSSNVEHWRPWAVACPAASIASSSRRSSAACASAAAGGGSCHCS